MDPHLGPAVKGGHACRKRVEQYNRARRGRDLTQFRVPPGTYGAAEGV